MKVFNSFVENHVDKARRQIKNAHSYDAESSLHKVGARLYRWKIFL